MIDFMGGWCLCPTPNGRHIPERVYRDDFTGRLPWTFCAECGWVLFGLYVITEEEW